MDLDIGFAKEMFALVADMNAIMVQVEGMKASNHQRAACDESVAWTEDHFQGAASDIEEISIKLRNL